MFSGWFWFLDRVFGPILLLSGIFLFPGACIALGILGHALTYGIMFVLEDV